MYRKPGNAEKKGLRSALLAAYTLQTTKAKKHKQRYGRGPELRRKLIDSCLANNKDIEKLSSRMRKLDTD